MKRGPPGGDRVPPESALWRGDSDTGENDQASSLPARVARYGRAKARAMAMAKYLEGEAQDSWDGAIRRKARALLRTCGNYLVFRQYWTVGEVRLHAACFCKQHLICPLCAIRRGSKALSAYLDRYEVVRQERPELNPYLVTFTVQNGEDLAERFGHLRTSFKVLTDRRKRFRGGSRGAPWTEFARVEGAVGSYEVTNKGKGWHPHLHMVCLCASGMDQQALRAEWEGITGDSFMVDVRPFRVSQGPAEGFMEVMKYAMKFGELSLADNWTAARIFAGSRLLFSLGCFRGVVVPESLTDEPLEGLPFVELFYRYLEGVGYSFERSVSGDEAA